MFDSLERAAGCLLHITSLPGPSGSGDLGPAARKFAAFLEESRLKYWQILPTNPTERKYHYSPYQSPSAFAGNPLMISPRLLAEEGILSGRELKRMGKPSPRADFVRVEEHKVELLKTACRTYLKDGSFLDFQERESDWLKDFALFQALRRSLNKPWHRWPAKLRDRDPLALEAAERDLSDPILIEKFTQFIFFRQWDLFRADLREKGIRLISDCPIYIPHQSADVWANAHLFQLDSRKRPAYVSGVPPDAFSRTGQLWGHPLYHWDRLKEDGYGWWRRRLSFLNRMGDIIRLDHFRGLVSYWRIPRKAKTAAGGLWVPAPAEDFLASLRDSLPDLSFIAEDLGIITPDVVEVMERFRLPGMKILLFAFESLDPDNPYLPHTFGPRSVVYTGTHDNNTVRGWYEKESSTSARKRLEDYLKNKVTSADVHWEMTRLALSSPSRLAVIPMQDFLGLGGEARMNLPGSRTGNWVWRLRPGDLTGALAERIAALCRETLRAR
jgi:4-alpha-glucanotransferase